MSGGGERSNDPDDGGVRDGLAADYFERAVGMLMLMLLYDLGEINERVRLYSFTVFLLVVGASLFAFLVSWRWRGAIATPIARLVSATTAVAETGHYWIRARASMAELMETPVDSAEALRNSLANLSEAIRQSGAEVTYDALPEVFMGEAHLQQVFQNLVGNALKYRITATNSYLGGAARGVLALFGEGQWDRDRSAV